MTAGCGLDVDEGSTVTDFLPAERARGITIQSAAVSFQWPPIASGVDPQSSTTKSSTTHTINLIDTPGHADFTFEVLRSLRILDGAVCILDGVAGVEAQTEKVWRQANIFQTPMVIYVNKLDRDGAAFNKTIKEIGTRLLVWPAVCQIPWWQINSGRFIGVGDVIGLRGLKWEEEGDGKIVTAYSIEELKVVDGDLEKELRRARIALVELLSEHDDEMVEKYLEYDEDHLAIPGSDVLRCLRKCLCQGLGKLVPVFAGASFRNMGVQPLLDAVVDLLPDPSERPDAEIAIGQSKSGLREFIEGQRLAIQRNDKLTANAKDTTSLGRASAASAVAIEACALAFKVVNDARRGVLVFVRVYHGIIHRGATLFNPNLQVSERAARLLKMYAADAEEVSMISAGQIGVITGLAHARTGDTLVTYAGGNWKKGPPPPWNDLRLKTIDVPPPVFFTSIVPHSLSEEKNLHGALRLLLREDPSLKVSIDEESGQTLLSGMGELHLEIARDRLVQDFKAKADISGIEIGYRDTLLGASSPVRRVFDSDIAGRKGRAGCEARLQPLHEAGLDGNSDNTNDLAHRIHRDGNVIDIYLDSSSGSSKRAGREYDDLPAHLDLHTLLTSLANGALGSLARSPVRAYPMHGTHAILKVSLQQDLFGADSIPSALASAARQATRVALREAAQRFGTSLMEPVMNVAISVDEASLGAVVHDLNSARGGHVLSLDDIDPSPSSSTTTPNDASNTPFSSPINVKHIYAPPDPFEANNNNSVGNTARLSAAAPRTIQARVPLKEMVGYLKHLRSLTGGRGTFIMTVDRFERMSPHREKKVLAALVGGWS